ncbi:MAG: hypothetical protein PHQ65_15045 [Bacteroidales bacterium]|nr:hypothetical protein [Bacteroidales bacterium]MDD3666581.1 hypothetical protein [Bacteroidales bacterium]
MVMIQLGGYQLHSEQRDVIYSWWMMRLVPACRKAPRRFARAYVLREDSQVSFTPGSLRCWTRISVVGLPSAEVFSPRPWGCLSQATLSPNPSPKERGTGHPSPARLML